MRKTKLIVCLLMAVAIAMPTLAGCGGGKELPDTENHLIIEMYEGGYGVEGMNAVAKAFLKEENEKNGNAYEVTIIPDPILVESQTYPKIGYGPSLSKTDMFMGIGDPKYILFEGPNYVSSVDEPYALEDLTDVYNANVYGESVPFGQKLIPSYKEYNAYRGYDKVVGSSAATTYFKEKDVPAKYYSVNWASGVTGFAYNKTHFDNNSASNWKIPVTTDEMVVLCDAMVEKGYKPFVFNSNYFDYAAMTWWRQCTTDQETDDFWNANIRSADGTMVTPNQASVLNSYERKQAFELIETFIGSKDTTVSGQAKSYEYGKYVFGEQNKYSVEYTHKEAQTKLYLTEKKAVFMPNGDWLENEMAKEGLHANQTSGNVTGDIGFMKFPVSSKVIYKACKKNNHNNCVHDGNDLDGNIGFFWRFDCVRSESALREVIKAVDAKETLATAKNRSGLSSLTQSEYDEFKKIRSVTYSQGISHNTFIPSYANAKEVAKKFLLFLASDKALQIYYDTTGTFLPFDNKNIVVKSDATTWQKDLKNLLDGVSFVSPFDSKNPLFFKTKLRFFSDQKFMATSIATTSASDKMTGSGWLQYLYTSNNSAWTTYLNDVANFQGY